MKLAVGSDHKGFALKEKIKAILCEMGNEVIDFGTDSEDSVDFPDFGLKVARAVADKQAERGITVCWTGNGMNITANKVNGIRAGMALNSEMAYYTRLHNDANIITLSAKYTPESEIREILEKFVATEFEGGRHTNRVNKIREAEKDCLPSDS